MRERGLLKEDIRWRGRLMRWMMMMLAMTMLRGGEAGVLRGRNGESKKGGGQQQQRNGTGTRMENKGTEGTCTTLGLRCGGMGAIDTVCCQGLVCKEQDAFFSGCIDANLDKEEPLNASPQTAIEVKTDSHDSKHNYAQALYLSILFYEAQRSGKLPANNRIPWRYDSGLADKGLKGEDLSGGWYDSGMYVKFQLPMAWTTTVLAWGVLRYGDAYRAAGEYEHVLDSIRWPLDYFIKAHTSPDEFYVQVGDQADQGYWGPPEAMITPRTPYRVTCANPGTEPVAETAAAMAASYLIFKDKDPEYASRLLSHSKELYDFGYRCQGNYVNDGRITAAEPFYYSYSGYKDELAWAGLWLFKATGNDTYLKIAKDMYPACCEGPNNSAFTWDDKSPGVQVLMYEVTGEEFFKKQVGDTLTSWMVGRPHTPLGLSFYTWAPNKFAASASFLALVAADLGIEADTYREFAKTQIHYLMGDWPGAADNTATTTGEGAGADDQQAATRTPHFSYVIGYGQTSPRAPHHRASSCPSHLTNSTCRCSSDPNYYTLYGALVGGPNMDDTYTDACPDFQKNEVCTNCNAGFQSAVAGLKHLAMTTTTRSTAPTAPATKGGRHKGKGSRE